MSEKENNEKFGGPYSVWTMDVRTISNQEWRTYSDRYAGRYPRQDEEERSRRVDQVGRRSRGRKRGGEESGEGDDDGMQNQESHKYNPTEYARNYANGNLG